jgi:hypothetical protein
LQVTGNMYLNGQIHFTTNTDIIKVTSGTMQFTTGNGVPKMQINDAGNTVIGLVPPNARKLYIEGSVGIKKDSVTRVTTIGSNEPLFIDTATDKIQRLPANYYATSTALSDSLQALEQVYVREVTTTDATPVNIDTITISPGQSIRVDVIVNAIIGSGDGAYVGKQSRTFLRNSGGTLIAGTTRTHDADEYLGSGLSTCTFTITTTGSDKIIIQWTGESGDTIKAKSTTTITLVDALL